MKYARYGPVERYDVPGAGMCLSVFAIIMNSRRQVLIGIPKKESRWQEDWLYSKTKENSEIFEQWRPPSCYLREGEHPEDALARVMRDELGAKEYQFEPNPKIVSYYSPSDWYPGQSHWDLAFVYRIKVGEGFQPSMKWWRQLEFCKLENLKEKDFGWNIDLMHDLQLT
jgi:ADP-ribose pyrophosphatase YjhB (NUDIX family)